MNLSGPQRIRPAAVAGRFYPGDSDELRQAIRRFVAAVPASPGPVPKALVAPHAGYPFSGPIAASAYAQWRGLHGQVQRVILMGPSHYVAFKGLAGSSYEAFATPLGIVRIDPAAMASVQAQPGVVVLDKAHEQEHALEVQLPFLQEVLGSFSLVPLLAGDADPIRVAELLDALWGGAETRIVISSDLSHYRDAAAAQALDQQTACAIEALQPELITREQACGRIPLQGLLHAACRRGMRARAIDVRHSGDTAGPRDRVVGYGAFGFEEVGQGGC
jgi:AmmeMemoRadiSam system protein B